MHAFEGAVDESPSDFGGDEGEGPNALVGWEAVVRRGIARHNARLAEAYRQIVVLTRGLGPPDRLAPILAMHLCRDLTNALPRAAGSGRAPKSEYADELSNLVEAWPSDPHGGRREVPERARLLLVALLASHETSLNRVTEFEEMVRLLDPSGLDQPTPLVSRRWAVINERAVAVAHDLMRLGDQWPSLTDARAITNELIRHRRADRGTNAGLA
jgi:hypothetical protein